jgi:hypothetical protein
MQVLKVDRADPAKSLMTMTTGSRPKSARSWTATVRPHTSFRSEMTYLSTSGLQAGAGEQRQDDADPEPPSTIG